MNNNIMLLNSQPKNNGLAITCSKQNVVIGNVNRIREIRKQLKLSQEQLGDLADTSQQQIQHLESGRKVLDVPWMEKIVAAFNQFLGYEKYHPWHLLTDEGKQAVFPESEYEKTMLTLMRQMSDRDQERFLHMGEAFLAPNPKIGKTKDTK